MVNSSIVRLRSLVQDSDELIRSFLQRLSGIVAECKLILQLPVHLKQIRTWGMISRLVTRFYCSRRINLVKSHEIFSHTLYTALKRKSRDSK